jgi:hypothetical protein
MKKTEILILIIFSIIVFLLGFWLELDYRILTRQTIQKFINIDFYPNKDWRFMEIDIACVLLLIPISLFIITKSINDQKTILKFALFYACLVFGFYHFYCFAESKYILNTIEQANIQNGIIKYHKDNVNYKMILIMTIVSTFIIEMIIKRILKNKASH